MGVEAIAAISIVGPLRAGFNDRCASTGGSIAIVHQVGIQPGEFSTACPHSTGPATRRWIDAPSAGRSRSDQPSVAWAPGRRIERSDLAGEAGQDQATGHELRRRHDVGMDGAPANGAIRVDGEGLELRLDHDVAQTG
jgi:hypothetical protein